LRLYFPDQTPTDDGLLPEFVTPPIVEASIGLQFDGLDGYQSLRAASFWDRVRNAYPILEEHPSLPPIFETFGPSDHQAVQPQIQIIQGAIHSRYFFISEARDEFIQLQPDRLFFNWRKRSGKDPYPRYVRVRAGLEGAMKEASQWVAAEKLGQVIPTQCEAAYVNHIPLRDRDGSPCGLSFFFPWLRGLHGLTEQGSFNFSRRLNDENGKPVARLHMALTYGSGEDGKREAQLLLHVRGRPQDGSPKGCLAMIDAEREVIVRAFAQITSPEAHELWERKQ
jgi:uncharacterized protein (TIGR04255 family)